MKLGKGKNMLTFVGSETGGRGCSSLPGRRGAGPLELIKTTDKKQVATLFGRGWGCSGGGGRASSQWRVEDRPNPLFEIRHRYLLLKLGKT